MEGVLGHHWDKESQLSPLPTWRTSIRSGVPYLAAINNED